MATPAPGFYTGNVDPNTQTGGNVFPGSFALSPEAQAAQNVAINQGSLGSSIGGGTGSGSSSPVTLGLGDQAEPKNNDTVTMPIGTPVYFDAGASCKRAKADAVGTTKVMGVVSDPAGIVNGFLGHIQLNGLLQVANTGDWDTITGGSGGLTASTMYYLSPTTAGKLTSTKPTTVGEFIVPVGRGLNPSIMQLTDSPNIIAL